MKTATRGQSAAILFTGHSENENWDIAALEICLFLSASAQQIKINKIKFYLLEILTNPHYKLY